MDGFYKKEFKFIREYVKKICQDIPYNTHHLDHILRVTEMAVSLGKELDANMAILETSALLHDIGRFREDADCHAEISANFANKFLKKRNWEESIIEAVCYAIKTHRYHKGITPTTLEAKILQDADKLDALGAIGIIRVVSYFPQTQLYSLENPFCDDRKPEDKYTLDHFYQKILNLKDAMHTEPAQKIATQRHQFLVNFLNQLKQELVIYTNKELE